MIKNPPANAGDVDSVPELGRSPGEGNGNPLQYSCLENLHGQRSLVGHSSRGQKESDRTEQLRTHTSIHAPIRGGGFPGGSRLSGLKEQAWAGRLGAHSLHWDSWRAETMHLVPLPMVGGLAQP